MTCVSCGADIPDKRLRAMPLTEVCTDCQAEREEADENKGRIQPYQVADALAVVEVDLSEVYGWGR